MSAGFTNPLTQVINSLLHEPYASLLNGIIFGTKANMPRAFYQALIDTGTLHVIALSGVNISILINLMGKATIVSGKKASSILTICLIVLFVLLVGPSPSVIRASLMGSLSLIAIFFGRREWGLLGLILSAAIMLLFKFSLIKDISFQLSFMATLGIILANNKRERQPGKVFPDRLIYLLKENLKMTLSAQIFTLPIIFYNFHRISLIAPLANLLTGWVIQPIMVFGLLTSVIGWVYLPLAIIPSWVVWIPLAYFILIIEWLAKVPGGSIML